MKTALVMVCSLVLVGTQFVSGRTPAAGVERRADACCHCGQASCCAAPNSPESQPGTAAPASSRAADPISMILASARVWTLPVAGEPEFSRISFSLLPTAGAPLYTRNCALLL